jgi:hypothetical protein
MSDEELDRLVRDADPYRAGLVARLGGAEHTLLEEIMSEPSSSRSRVRHTRWWRTAAVLSAAAAITGILAVPALLAAHRPAKPAPAIAFLSPGSAPSAAASAAPSPTGKPTELLKTTADKVLLLIGEPGWEITNVYGFGAAEGTIVYAKGDLSLDVTWYQADYYAGYYQDRLEVSAPAPGAVDGWNGDVFTYSESDWELMLRPRNGVFAGLRTSGPWTRAGFDAVLAATDRVGAQTWLHALPADTVTPPEVDRAAQQVLAGVPLPPGFEAHALAIPGVNDPYQFGAQVIGRVGCGWIDEWTRAKKDGDAAAAGRAATALTSSRDWPALKNMQAEGGYSESFWDLADRVAAGKSPGDYRNELSCV